MGLEFRLRDYTSENQSHSLPRTCATTHPLQISPSSHIQAEQLKIDGDNFVDPLRANFGEMEISIEDRQQGNVNFEVTLSEEDVAKSRMKEWSAFKKLLVQRFPVSKTVQVRGVFLKGNKAYEKSSRDLRLEELEDHQIGKEDVRVITQQEYVSQLQELKEEIRRSWSGDDRVTALRLSVKVAKLLMDTSAIQFYPTLFVLATDIMDMLGDLVWTRIKQKAEVSVDGVSICSLPDHFKASDICFEAKETCNNWFSKIGSVRELLPRIYLELSILGCWRFLLDSHEDILQRLVSMIRGIADPLASAYCSLYMVQCAQRLPQLDKGCLIACINDLQMIIKRTISKEEVSHGKLSVDSKFILTMIEPAIEYIMRSLFKDVNQMEIVNMLVALGLGMNSSTLFQNCSCVSIILHHMLEELPIGFTCSNAVEILNLIERTNDSSYDQCLNIKLVGIRLCERISEVKRFQLVVDIIFKVLSSSDKLDAYLMIAEAYLDIILENQLDTYLIVLLDGMFELVQEVKISEYELVTLQSIFLKLITYFGNIENVLELVCLFVQLMRTYLIVLLDTYLIVLLDGMFELVQEVKISEYELVTLQSIFLKLITYFGNIENVLELNHFVDILDILHGSSRNTISMHLLTMGTRNGPIRDPTIIEFLSEVAQALYDGVDFSNMRKDDYQLPARAITHFVIMVDYGTDFKSHLRFLVQCRGAFASMPELQEILVHSSNYLAVKTVRDRNNNTSFVKSCLAFSEVTIPSIPSNLRQLNLYLEAAEIALLSGLVSHSDGLIDAAVNCVQNIDSDYGLLWLPEEANGIVSLICKLCAILVMVPVSFEKGVACFPERILSFLDSHSWVLPWMKIRVSSAVVILLSTLAQRQLPYHAVSQVVTGNDQLFYGVPSYLEELLSLSSGILHNIVESVLLEPSMAIRGKIALEACNCVALVFKACSETLEICSKLVEIARSCLSAEDRLLQSTLTSLQARQFRL